MRTPIRYLMLGVLVAAPLLRAADENVYRNTTLGFSIQKPATWFFETMATDGDTRAVSDSPVKMIMITRYKEPYPELNASLSISCVSRDEVAVTVPKTLVRIIVNRIVERYEDASVQEGPSEATIAGLKGAYARVFFEGKLKEGDRAAASEEVWVLVAGDLYCIATGESRQDEKTGSRNELRQILETMKVDGKAKPAERRTPSALSAPSAVR